MVPPGKSNNSTTFSYFSTNIQHIQGVPKDFIYICTEVCELTLHIVYTLLKDLVQKKIEESKIWKTVGRVAKSTAAKLTTNLTFS